MTWPTSIWLSIVFAFLLVAETWTTEASTEKPYEQQTGDNANYDVIDVAANEQNNGDYNKLLTGQTTRIILTGEVDDEFWLKHLGEDYKHAIHLVVGSQNAYGNKYPDEFSHNMTNEHHATVTGVEGAYDVQAHAEDYDEPKAYPVENVEVEQPKPFQNYVPDSIVNITRSAGSNTTEQAEATQLELTKKANELKNETAPRNLFEEQEAYERIFAMEDTNLGLAKAFYNPNSFYMPDEHSHKHSHYTDTPHKYSTHTKYTQPESYTNTYTNAAQEATTTKTDDHEHSGDGAGDHATNGNYSASAPQSAVVVNLPETDNTIVQQLGQHNTPVVVKMPPVIYHQKSQQYPSPPATQSYTSQILPYPLSQAYPNFYQQTHSPQQQYRAYHDSNYARRHMASSYNPLNYSGANMYQPTTSNSEDILNGLRYYFSKSSSVSSPATTQKLSAAQEQTQNEEEGSGSNDSYPRVSRSNQQLFDGGL